MAVAATAAAKGLAALPIVTFEKAGRELAALPIAPLKKAAKGLAALPNVTFEKVGRGLRSAPESEPPTGRCPPSRKRANGNGVKIQGRSMFVRLGGKVGRLVSAVPNIERPDPV